MWDIIDKNMKKIGIYKNGYVYDGVKKYKIINGLEWWPTTNQEIEFEPIGDLDARIIKIGKHVGQQH